MKGPSALALASLVLSAPLAAGEPGRYALDQDQVLLTWQAALGPKQLNGVARSVSGAVEESPGGRLHVTVSAPLASFSSGNGAVDALFSRAIQADRFPAVEFHGEASAPRKNGQFTVQVQGMLSAHGVQRPLTVPVKVVRDGKTLFVKTAFPVDLAAHGVEVPSIGAVAVSPRVQVELFALLRPAVRTGSGGDL